MCEAGQTVVHAFNTIWRICIESTRRWWWWCWGGACVRSLAPAATHSQPASLSTEGRPASSPARVRPAQRNLIYYPRFCLRLDSVDAIDSRLMNCIRGVDYFRTLLVYLWRAFAHLKAEMEDEEGKKKKTRQAVVDGDLRLLRSH